MAFNTPVAAYASSAAIVPPVEADAFSFNANSYSSGDWIDETNGYTATIAGNPTLVPATNDYNASIDFDRVGDTFKIDNSELTSGKLWSSQGVAGGAVGTLEWVINFDFLNSTSQTPFGYWNSTASQRAFLFGNCNASQMSILFGSIPTGASNRSYKTMDHGLTATTWNHWVLTWSMASNFIRIYVNNSLVDTETWTNTSVEWNAPTNSCPVIGAEQGGCSASAKNFFGGFLGAMRGYNTALGTTQIDELYNFWKPYYGIA